MANKTFYVPIRDYNHAILLTDLHRNVLIEGNVNTGQVDFQEWCDKYGLEKNLMTYTISYMLWLGITLIEYWSGI